VEGGWRDGAGRGVALPAAMPDSGELGKLTIMIHAFTKRLGVGAAFHGSC
jgi:hypothetical protein